MLRPLTIALAYFAVEGVVRGLAAFISGEVLPTLPLALVAAVHQKLSEQRAELSLSGRAPDEIGVVNSPDIKLRIRSCRPRSSWDERITIFYRDNLYEVADAKTVSPQGSSYIHCAVDLAIKSPAEAVITIPTK
jgi:hypothetical protein